MISECIFCEERKIPSIVKRFANWWPTDSRIIYQDEHMMAIPGLGPIIPSSPYVLVVPKTCAPSFLETPEQEQTAMFCFLEKIRQREDLFPGKVLLVFEHGSREGNAGCSCISHCHLHVMNVIGRHVLLPDRLKERFSESEKVEFLPGSTGEGPYLFAGHYGARGEPRLVGQICRSEHREIQMIRRLVAELTGGIWDYRKGENPQTMFGTYGKLTGNLI